MLESDGYLLDELQGLLQRPLRDADLRRGPRRPAALRRRRPRRLRHLPGRRRRVRRSSGPPAPSSVTTSRSASATCTTTWRATRGPTATPSTSTTTTSTTTRSACRPTSSPAPAIRATRATRCSSRTTSSTRTTSTSTRPDSSVKPAFPFPVGTGLWIAGGNHHQVRDNYFYDNWRRGTMLFSVPDQLVCGPAAGGNQQAGCDPNGQTTSFYNSQYDNHMGVRPDGTADPNGTDFWWDPYPGTVGNCWWGNTPAPGRDDHVLAVGAPLPELRDGTKPDESVGTGNPRADRRAAAACVAAFETRDVRPERAVPVVQDAARAPARRRRPPQRAAPPAFSRRSRPRVRAVVGGRIDQRSDLSGVSCAQWNTAGDDGRAWLVAEDPRVRRRRGQRRQRRWSATATR